MIAWASRVVEQAIGEIYIVDLVRERVLPADLRLWSAGHVAELHRIEEAAREIHHRAMEGQAYKAIEPRQLSADAWAERAEMPLFRAKRCGELAALIEMRTAITEAAASADEIQGLHRDVLARVVKVARSKTVGTEIADLTVCGAVAPYSHLAGGKLVALLAVSPAAVAEYQRRYKATPGIIASSIAGRAIARRANLVYVGTTSLYGRRPNQYDRLAMPASVVGGFPNDAIRFQHIRDTAAARTAGVGTFQFSPATLKALETYVQSQQGGWRVNNVFGEGTSPKLRGLRDGFDALGMNASRLLVHGIEKCLYGVRLAKNADRYLMGFDGQPDWLFDPHCGDGGVKQIYAWWASRWGAGRAAREDVLAAIKKETLVHPIRHGGRVPRHSPRPRQSSFFDI